MGFYILKSDLNDVGSSFTDYSNAVSEKFGTLGTKITALSELTSFKGDAADSIKSYFSDIHIPLASSIAKAAEQLCSDYFAEYLDRYTNSPLNENDWGKLSEDELDTTKKAWVDDQQTRWDEINSQLDQAIASLPGDVSLSKPNAQSANAELIKLGTNLRQLVSNVRSAEAAGKNVFGQQSTTFSDLLNSINEAISQCTYEMTSYESGAFNTVLEATGLRDAFNASLENCEANAEKMIQNQEVMYDQLCEREVRKQEEERAFWEGVGIVLGVGLLIAGVAATIATAGAAGPVVAGLTYTIGGFSAAKTTADLINRGNKLAGKEKNEFIDGFKEGASGEKDILEVANPAAKHVDLLTSKSADKINSRYIDELGTHRATQTKAKGANVVTGLVTEWGADRMKKELNSPEGDFAVDTGKRVVDEFVDHQFDNIGAIKPKSYSIGKADAASLALGFMQDGADYKSAKCDEAIESAYQQRDERKARVHDRSFSQRPAWAMA